ncbi:MAG TPA: IS110 family transposase [Verrucomicrobiae bacterium]|nr:IS110 family transposase [Verrucomicrobiae bacterium]
MQVLHPCCAGLDVHKASVVACVMLTAADGSLAQETKTFGTTTAELLALGDWLKSQGVTVAAMESTGVYWKPIYNLLEGQLELLVVNAQHIKAVPGRKTDVADAAWIADLLRHGLLRGSFIPPQPQRELRELVRHRTNLVGRRAQAVNELHKILESTNLKLGNVVSDLTGVSATEMLQALVAGKTDPAVLAELGRGQLRKKKPELQAALRGELRAHHKLILSQLLADISWCEEQIAEVSAEIAARLKEQDELIDRLDDIPGVNRRVAEIIVAEVGGDVKRFPTAQHLISWAGLCPGNNESAGRRKSSRIRPGNRSLRCGLIEAAQAGRRKKGSYLSALFGRLAGRRGKKRALIAVGRTILQSAYHMIERGARYEDLGADYYERRNPEGLARRLAKRIEKLGFAVTLQSLPQAA